MQPLQPFHDISLHPAGLFDHSEEARLSRELTSVRSRIKPRDASQNRRIQKVYGTRPFRRRRSQQCASPDKGSYHVTSETPEAPEAFKAFQVQDYYNSAGIDSWQPAGGKNFANMLHSLFAPFRRIQGDQQEEDNSPSTTTHNIVKSISRATLWNRKAIKKTRKAAEPAITEPDEHHEEYFDSVPSLRMSEFTRRADVSMMSTTSRTSHAPSRPSDWDLDFEADADQSIAFGRQTLLRSSNMRVSKQSSERKSVNRFLPIHRSAPATEMEKLDIAVVEEENDGKSPSSLQAQSMMVKEDGHHFGKVKSTSSLHQMPLRHMKTIQQFTNVLTKHGVDVFRFGKGGAKSIHELWDEFMQGRLQLFENPETGGLVRKVDVLRFEVKVKMHGKLKHLVEVREQYRDGRERPVNKIPAGKLDFGEQWRDGLVRLLVEELELSHAWLDRNIEIDDDSYKSWEECTTSSGYPGLVSIYQLHEATVHVKKPDELFFVLGMPHLADFRTTDDKRTRFWSWKAEDETYSFKAYESSTRR